MNLSHTRAAALTAAVDALLGRGELAHARVFFAELRGLLEAVWTGDVVHRDMKPEHPQNPVVHMEQPSADATPTSPVARPAAKPAPLTGAERQARYMANKRAQAAGASKQLPLVVTSVTDRHSMDVTIVSGDVTRAASLASSLSPLEPSKGSYGERARVSPDRDAVTMTLTPPEDLDDELVAIFDEEMALRTAVQFSKAWLWRKFRKHGYDLRSRTHMEIMWRKWCKAERPTKESTEALEQEAAVPLSAPTPEVEKGEASPGVRSAGVDLEEQLRRVEVERRERMAREAAELRAQHESRWEGRQRDPFAAFTPEALEAARRAS